MKPDKETTRLEELADYKYHPRLLELRLIGIYNILVNEYGLQNANDVFQRLCDTFRLPYNILWSVISKANRIQHSIYISKDRYTQEVVLMGELWGETRYTVATKFLGLKNYNYLYQSKDKHNLDYFATDEWLAELDNEVTVAGVDAISNVIINFLTSLETFLNLF